MSFARRIAGYLVVGACSALLFPALGAAQSASANEGMNGIADEKARQTFREGIDAFDRRDFEAARVAFLQTFALKPNLPVVSRNLGLAEIYSGYYLEGARRLTRVLHTTSDGNVQDRTRMLESLKKAEAHLERLTLEVNVEGAQIAVEETELGASPLPFAWYVAPGSYDVRVEKAGYAAFSVTNIARAGRAQHLRVVLEPMADVQSQSDLSMSPLMDDSAHGPEPWILVAGGLGVAAGLASGITLSVLASDSADEVDQLGSSLNGFSCPSPNLTACADLDAAAERHDTEGRWAAVSFVTAGVIGTATLLYALLAEGDEAVTAARVRSSGTLGIKSGLHIEVDRRFVSWQTSF